MYPTSAEALSKSPGAPMKYPGRPVQALIVVPEEVCGPALAALSPPQRAFVIALVQFGCTGAEAARRAGYSDRGEGGKVVAYRLTHDDRVQAAILEESRKVMRAEGPRSILTLVQIRDDKELDAKSRIKAATELLNRGGLHAISEQHVSVEHRLSDAEKDRRILALCQELGMAPTEARKLLIAPDAIEAKFTVIEPAGPPTEEEARKVAKRDRNNEAKRHRRKLTPAALKAHKAAVQAAHSARRKAAYVAAQAERAASATEETGQ
jgi:hypothetical protein